MRKSILILSVLMTVFVLFSCGETDPTDEDDSVTINDQPYGFSGMYAASVSDAPAAADSSSATDFTNEAELLSAISNGSAVKFSGSSKKTIKLSAPIVVDKDLLIDGAGLLTLDGQDSHRVLETQAGVDLELQNLTIKNGKAPDDSSKHFVYHCGGAVLVNGGSADTGSGTFTAVNVNFIDNSAPSTSASGDVRGGAVYLFNIPTAKFSSCTFTDNWSDNGGAIGGLGSSVYIYKSYFTNNEARSDTKWGQHGNGGALSLDGVDQNNVNAELHIVESTFYGNVSSNISGAINYVMHAPGDAGYEMETKVIIQDSHFEENKAKSQSGGAIYHQEGDIAILRCSFVRNEAYNYGGAIRTYNGRDTKRVCIENCTFFENKIPSKNDMGMGGAVAFNGGDNDIVHCTFVSNYAYFHGGAVQAGTIESGGNVMAKNCLFVNNTSERDWAVYQANTKLSDGGGNMQYLDEELEGDSSSDNAVTDTATETSITLLGFDDNGGKTKTFAIPSDSPAKDAGSTSTPVLSGDQRGESRDSSPDVGAYEYTQ